MIVIQHNIDIARPLASSAGSRPATAASRSPCATCPSATTSTCPSASRSSSSSTPSNHAVPNVVKGPRHPHARHPAPHRRSPRRGRRQPSALRRRPARARLRPHHRQLAAPHAAVVDPRRGHHHRALRRRAARVRHHRRCHRGRHRHHPEPQGHRPHLDSATSRSSLRLDVRGPADITAGDIKCPSDIEILNKDLHIATLNAKGRLAVDLTVERAVATCRATATRRTARSASIPIDAIFSPVRRVMFEIEPTRVEQTHELRPPRPRHRDRRFDHARARRSPRPAPRCARWSTSSPT